MSAHGLLNLLNTIILTIRRVPPVGIQISTKNTPIFSTIKCLGTFIYRFRKSWCRNILDYINTPKFKVDLFYLCSMF